MSVWITSVHDEEVAVPLLGKRNTKAVGHKIDFHDGTESIVSTGHLIAEQGHWRWTLSGASFESLSGGICP